jgi:hypothetical protein
LGQVPDFVPQLQGVLARQQMLEVGIDYGEHDPEEDARASIKQHDVPDPQHTLEGQHVDICSQHPAFQALHDFFKNSGL